MPDLSSLPVQLSSSLLSAQACHWRPRILLTGTVPAEAHVASPSPFAAGSYNALGGQSLTVKDGFVFVDDRGVSRRVGVLGSMTVYNAGAEPMSAA